MINIIFFFIQLFILFLFYKLYFYHIIEYINLFFVHEIKNFLLSKLNLFNNNFAMEINNVKQDPQQIHLDEIENKEYSKKEKILITVG
jgi:hypothetical protein